MVYLYVVRIGKVHARHFDSKIVFLVKLAEAPFLARFLPLSLSCLSKSEGSDVEAFTHWILGAWVCKVRFLPFVKVVMNKKRFILSFLLLFACKQIIDFFVWDGHSWRG